MIIKTFQDFFRIVSFLFFVVLMIRVIARQGIPLVQELYNKYKKNIQDKIKSREKILLHQKDVTHIIVNEHHEGLRLIDKIKIWRAKEEALHVHKKEALLKARSTLYAYMTEQVHYLSILTVNKKLIPTIKETVENKITRLYEDNDKQKEYIKQCIDSLPDIKI